MTYKDIMRAIPALHATHLVGENLKFTKKKNMKPHHMVNIGVKNIVGTSFIKMESDLIEGL